MKPSTDNRPRHWNVAQFLPSPPLPVEVEVRISAVHGHGPFARSWPIVMTDDGYRRLVDAALRLEARYLNEQREGA